MEAGNSALEDEKMEQRIGEEEGEKSGEEQDVAEKSYRASTNSTSANCGNLVSRHCGDEAPTLMAMAMHATKSQETREESRQEDITGVDALASPGSNEGGTSGEKPGINEDTASAPPETPLRRSGSSSSSETLPLILCSLSIDSLHCIASFLAPKDWSNFGQASKSTRRVGDQVFHRVRIHGFRCATEVISAWKLGQHSDARELSALYIKKGVPIYPHSLGHSYHTLTWRMGIEARELEGNTKSARGDSEEEPHGEDNARTRPPVDRFFSERYDAQLNDGYNCPDLTYLEEKCLFWHNQNQKSDVGDGGGRSHAGRASFVPPPPVLQPRDGIGVPVRFPEFRPASSNQPSEGQRGGLSSPASPPFAELKPHTPRLAVRVHRHLVNQHFHGRPSVDDESGAMHTPPVSLSEDFYHPYIAMKSASANMVASSDKFLFGKTSAAVVNQQQGNVAPASSAERIVPPIPTPPDSDQGTPNAAALHSALQNAAMNGVEEVEVNDGDRRGSDFEPPVARTPTQMETPMLSPPPLGRNEVFETPPRVEHPIVSNVDLEIYNSISMTPLQNDGISSHLSARFAAYQRRLELMLAEHDDAAFEECVLDFWDEFFPTTANIHFYDRYTAVPRVSCLQQFLTMPCPKAIGIVQCEIERIRMHPRKKGVSMKGRIFPWYEYRLFIRDRRHTNSVAEYVARDPKEEPRRDTVLMTAKNRGKKHQDVVDQSLASHSSRKGVNNYYLNTPQQSDVNAHYNSVNEVERDDSSKLPNGASYAEVTLREGSNGLLGRLQSNFTGTEFQIFSQSVQKRPARIARSLLPLSSDSENEWDYDSAVSSDNLSTSSASGRRGRFRRRSRKPKGLDSSFDLPQPINEEPPSPSRSLSPEGRKYIRRAMSLPVIPYSRSSRTSRRAIAHSIEPLDSQCFRPTFCEEEEGAITYTANLLGNRPRIMDVCIPRVSPGGVSGFEWKKYLDSSDEGGDGSSKNQMLTCFKQLQQRLENPNQRDEENITPTSDGHVPPDDFGLVALQNRPPWWNIELGAFVLNFGGRVSVASVKNFQLCERTNQDHILLQFGRIQGRHSFTMDFQHPLTAVQAFAIAISSLQSKISFG